MSLKAEKNYGSRSRACLKRMETKPTGVGTGLTLSRLTKKRREPRYGQFEISVPEKMPKKVHMR